MGYVELRRYPSQDEALAYAQALIDHDVWEANHIFTFKMDDGQYSVNVD